MIEAEHILLRNTLKDPFDDRFAFVYDRRSPPKFSQHHLIRRVLGRDRCDIQALRWYSCSYGNYRRRMSGFRFDRQWEGDMKGRSSFLHQVCIFFIEQNRLPWTWSGMPSSRRARRRLALS
ncbi:uncharacterized protein LOC120270537 isoform X1 [Dioscorea cayenensis subsp. rotundata]|uniref:Uncharacterized protein LOC120270537 isoform X1 n=1 Tax=Dioscorea cayennensis subsp. rotundata TaxID=55577 RepID=A0AB40C3Q1_DIOCR|nr:uncharacterized protein LOC120270537 isoform X1 [Dioscorea cayenensis subsp. rotundata]